MSTLFRTTEKRGRFKTLAARFGAGLLALALVCTLIPATAGAVTQEQINNLKQQQKQIANDKKAIEGKLSNVKNDKAAALQRKALLEEDIDNIRQNLKVVTALIASYEEQIAEKTIELEAAQAEEARYYDLFLTRVRAMEEGGGNSSYWAILFHATDFADLLDSLNMISEIMTHDNYVMDSLAAAREAVAAAKAELETAKAEQEDAKAQLEASQAELQRQQAQVDALVDEMRAQEAAYEEQLHEMEQNAAALAINLSNVEKQYAAEIAAAKAAAASGTLAGTGGFIWPLPGGPGDYTITSKYGWRDCPFHGREYHSGVDVAAGGGTTIKAAKSGTVVISAFHSSYGNYVVIAHTDGTKTLYAHMRSRAVDPGQTVSQGTTIGYVGTTGTSTGNHLHFEVWTGSSSSSRTNPMNYF